MLAMILFLIVPWNVSTMRFGSTAKVLLKCKLKYYRISECVSFCMTIPAGH